MLSRNSAPEQTWKRCGENLVKYTPSGTYYVRVRVAGKLHVKSRETPVLTVARQRLTDELHKLRARAASVMAARAGKMRVADAVAIYRERLEADAPIKLSTRKYYEQVLTALCDHRRVSEPKPRQDKWHAFAFSDRELRHRAQVFAVRFDRSAQDKRLKPGITAAGILLTCCIFLLAWQYLAVAFIGFTHFGIGLGSYATTFNRRRTLERAAGQRRFSFRSLQDGFVVRRCLWCRDFRGNFQRTEHA
jgi:hypothetical protein